LCSGFCPVPESGGSETSPGSRIIGIGWGLVGYCPGPALAGIGLGNPSTVLFVAAMIVGMGGYRGMQWLSIGAEV
jgi:uncharacterized membrane protein YedE/YeeE